MWVPITSWLVGVTWWNFLGDVARCRCDNMCTTFGRGAPNKIWEGKKTSKFRRDFGQLSTLSANNSRMYQPNENLNSKWSTTTPPTLRVKNLVNFGPQTKSYRRTCWPTQLDFFSGSYISAFRWCCPLIFLHTWQPRTLYFQFDLGRRVASSWALPYISSYYYYALTLASEKKHSLWNCIVGIT